MRFTPDVIPPVLQRALSSQETFAQALFKRSESLSRFLPYDEYLPQFGLFRQKDGSLGAVYEVALCEHETKSAQEIVGLLSGLRSWFRLGADLVLSLLFDQAPISSHDASWSGLVSAAASAFCEAPSIAVPSPSPPFLAEARLFRTESSLVLIL